MTMRAIFRFENLDSTRDLNSRFEGLFKRGVYEGGNVEIVNGSYVKVSKFKALSEDGMAIINDEDTIVPIPSTRNSYYIILNARYVTDSEPIMELTAVETTAIGNYQSPVKFALIVNQQVLTDNTNYRDVIDAVGRNQYKGQINQNDLPNTGNVEGDWYFVKEGQFYKLYLWNGGSWTIFESISHIQDDLSDHRKNVVTDSLDTESSTGYWNYPSRGTSEVPQKITEDWAKKEQYGSYHLSINKWYASESISRIWTEVGGEWSNVDNNDSFKSLTCNSYYEYLKDRGITWNTTYTKAVGDKLLQIPSNNNKFITQNYPLLPTADEKYAIAGNLSDIIDSSSNVKYPIGLNNKLISQKTAGVAIASVDVQNIEAENDGYYYYPINSDSTSLHIYVGKIAESDVWIKYFRYTVAIPNTNNTSLLPELYTICTKSGSVYSEITSSNLVSDTDPDRCSKRGFLKNNVVYYLKCHDKLEGNIYYYVESDIDSTQFAFLHESEYKPYSTIVNLNSSQVSTQSLRLCYDAMQGYLSISANGELKYSYEGIEYKVFLIKDSN